MKLTTFIIMWNFFEYTFGSGGIASLKWKFMDPNHRPPDITSSLSNNNVHTHWIEQRLDHFNNSDTRTWSMRYMSMSDYFKSGSPVFIYVGGEWSISENYLRTGYIVDMVRETSGIMFSTEHRYYGQSHPRKSTGSENLKYLNIDQALADLAYFVKSIKSTAKFRNSGVILIGISYAGSLVTWFRSIYPELSNGAWASSAPVLAKLDFQEYMEIVGESIKLKGGKNCYKRIQRSFQKLEYLLKDNEYQLARILKLCPGFSAKNVLNVWSLFHSISNMFASLLEKNEYDTQNACRMIMSKYDDLEGLITWLYQDFRPNRCIPANYDGIVKYYRDRTPLWMYQSCSELGWYQTSTSKYQPFGNLFPVNFNIQLCIDIFGKTFNYKSIHQNILRTNQKFGGLNPNVTNIYFTHGGLDPWNILGITKDLNKYALADVIPSYAHGRDVYSSKSDNSTEIRYVKDRVKQLVYQWLNL